MLSAQATKLIKRALSQAFLRKPKKKSSVKVKSEKAEKQNSTDFFTFTLFHSFTFQLNIVSFVFIAHFTEL
jgi:hypothetical protein